MAVIRTSSFCFSSFLFVIILKAHFPLTGSQIIGSSVVTSVSVVLEDDDPDWTSTTPPPTTTTTTTFKPSVTTPSHNLKSSDQGVLSVIATLKNIVEKEQQKLSSAGAAGEPIRKPLPTNVEKNDQKVTAPEPPQKSLPDNGIPQTGNASTSTFKSSATTEDDDEAEDAIPVTAKVQGQTDYPVTVVVQSADSSAENDTATSAEVHEAIHRISGALLTPGKKSTKPIENVLTDVLASINDARNASGGAASPKPGAKTTPKPAAKTTPKPSVKSSQKTTGKGSPKPPPPRTTPKAPAPTPPATRSPTPMTKDKSTSRTTVTASSIFVTQASEPEIGTLGAAVRLPGLQSDDDASREQETEEDLSPISIPVTLSTPKPKPAVTSAKPKTTKPPILYFTGGKKNFTVGHHRPTDFYDDEIFGYDPYQTFLHGVYVASGVSGTDGGTRDSMGAKDKDPVITTCKPDSEEMPAKRPQPVHQGLRTKPANEHEPLVVGSLNTGSNTKTKTKKPVPSLPDHLHRPRPSHLQYQHSAADNIDPDSGLASLKVPHPGEKYANPEEHFGADRLASIPRPVLPAAIVKNLTDHHHEAHHGHGGAHGHGGGHGHGGVHGHDGGHAHDGAHGHDHGHGAHHSTAHGEDHVHGHGTYHVNHDHHSHHHLHTSNERKPTFPKAPTGNPGLEATITNLDTEMRSFVDVNNRLALRLFSSLTNPVSKSADSYNNMVISPFTVISSLGMLFLGARGSTAAQLDGLLNMDDVMTFNPHLMYSNISQSFLSVPNTAAALIRLLITDKDKGDVLDFFKTRVQNFYDARIEEANYKYSGHLAQSIINQMIRAQIHRHAYEMINESLPLKGPLSLLTAAFFDGQFSGSRDHFIADMDFIHLANLGRRLIQVPALAVRGTLKATYDQELDATAVEVPYSSRELSLILIMPGKAGEFAIGGVTSLKSRLTLESWTALMRGFYARDAFKVVFPRFRTHSALNLTYTLQRFGLTDMFQPHLAKFKGINGLADLHLDQNIMHFSEFGTWEKLADSLSEASESTHKKFDLVRILRPHVRENYGSYAEPMSVNDWVFMSRTPAPLPRNSNLNSKHSSPNSVTYTKVRSTRRRAGENDPLPDDRSPNRNSFRQEVAVAEPEPEKVLRFERPFLYVVRHNPTGMILMTGQYTEPVTAAAQEKQT